MYTCKALGVEALSHRQRTSGGGARAASTATATAAQVAATRQASTREWRRSTARATRTQQRRNKHCTASCTALRDASRAPSMRHLTCENTRQTARKRCNNAGAAWIEARHPRASAASLLQQPCACKQQRAGVAERGEQQHITQTAAFAAPAHTQHTHQSTREHARKRRRTRHSCQTRTGGAPWATWTCCASCARRARRPLASSHHHLLASVAAEKVRKREKGERK
jgi:hypothetical protein